MSCCSVAKLRLTLRPQGLQHADSPVLHYLPEFAQTRVCWVSDAIQPSHPLSPSSPTPSVFPSYRVFSVNQFFTSGGQSIGASALASVLRMNVQDWFPLGWTGWISLQSKGLSKAFSSTTVWKPQFFHSQSSLWSNSHIHTWLLEKPYLWLYEPLSAKLLLTHCLGLSQLFFQESRFFWFHGCSHHLQWFWSPRKWSLSLFPFFSLSTCHEIMGQDAMILVFWMWSFKPVFHGDSECSWVLSFQRPCFHPPICHHLPILASTLLIHPPTYPSTHPPMHRHPPPIHCFSTCDC